MSRTRIILNVLAGIIILSGILYAKHELFPGQSNPKDDPLVGKKVTLGLPLVYAEGAHVSGESKIVTETGRRLLCPSDTMYAAYFAPYFYDDGVPHIKYVPINMEFTVEKVYGDGETYPNTGDPEWEQVLIDTGKTVILRDTNGVESTASAYSVKTPGTFCLNGDSAEISVDTRAIFKKIEQNGSARIEVLLSEPLPGNAVARKSDESTRSNFIKALPSRYTFNEITPIQSTVKQYGIDYPRYGVQMTVNADAFAYLLALKPGLNIESIRGI